jgi:hypothetical protein
VLPFCFKVSPWSCNRRDCLSWFDLDSRHLVVVGIWKYTVGVVDRYMLWFFYWLTADIKCPIKQFCWSLLKIIYFWTIPSWCQDIEFLEHTSLGWNCLCIYCTYILSLCFVGNLSTNKGLSMPKSCIVCFCYLCVL